MTPVRGDRIGRRTKVAALVVGLVLAGRLALLGLMAIEPERPAPTRVRVPPVASLRSLLQTSTTALLDDVDIVVVATARPVSETLTLEWCAGLEPDFACRTYRVLEQQLTADAAILDDGELEAAHLTVWSQAGTGDNGSSLALEPGQSYLVFGIQDGEAGDGVFARRAAIELDDPDGPVRLADGSEAPFAAGLTQSRFVDEVASVIAANWAPRDEPLALVGQGYRPIPAWITHVTTTLESSSYSRVLQPLQKQFTRGAAAPIASLARGGSTRVTRAWKRHMNYGVTHQYYEAEYLEFLLNDMFANGSRPLIQGYFEDRERSGPTCLFLVVGDIVVRTTAGDDYMAVGMHLCRQSPSRWRWQLFSYDRYTDILAGWVALNPSATYTVLRPITVGPLE